MEVSTRNVNTGFKSLVTLFWRGQEWAKGTAYVEESSTCADIRKVPYSNPNGSGCRLQIMEPVLVNYSHPLERVLFNQARDANPFFHLYEALWMLAGRNDVEPLQYYTKGYTFTDNGKTVPGAYGYRWRNAIYRTPDPTYTVSHSHFIDQLSVLIHHLKRKPESSRAVLSMWNVEDDLLNIEDSKDVCCNLNVMFSLRQTSTHEVLRRVEYALDITVTNRSNDLILGLLGANFVHFSFLQEYMANALGVEVGRYNHFTNNLHVYVPSEESKGRQYRWEPKKWLAADMSKGLYVPYCNWKHVPLVKDRGVFDEEVKLLVESFSGKEPVSDPLQDYSEPFLQTVARPMLTAYCSYRKGTCTVLEWAERIQDDAWRIAATEWLKRRIK